MRSSSEKTSVTGCFVLIGLVIIGILGYSLIRYFVDKPIFNEAHNAFLQGDCLTADPLYSKIIQKIKIFDFGNINKKLRRKNLNIVMNSLMPLIQP